MSDPVAEAAAQIAAQAAETANAATEAGTAEVGELSKDGTSVARESIATAAMDIAASAMTGTATSSDASQPDQPSSTSEAVSQLSASAESPNGALDADAPTTEPASAPSAAGSDITSPTVASSDEPLHVRIASHLEAIFAMTKAHEEASGLAAKQAAIDLKARIDDILLKINNGMSVAHGEMVQKLEKLFHML